MRAFDVLTKVEFDIRGSAYPRYHLEMALLRWIHLRKLVPIEDLITGAASGAPAPVVRPAPPAAKPAPGKIQAMASAAASRVVAPAAPVAASSSAKADVALGDVAKGDVASGFSRTEGNFKDAFLAEIRKGKPVLYNMCVAQAQKIEINGDRAVFTFSAGQRALRDQFEQNRAWLESVAQQAAGRRIAVAAVQLEAAAAPVPGPGEAPPPPDRKAELRQQALAEPGIQAMLEVFPAEIRDVEEM